MHMLKFEKYFGKALQNKHSPSPIFAIPHASFCLRTFALAICYAWNALFIYLHGLLSHLLQDFTQMSPPL